MSRFLDKIKNFFKREREESESCDDDVKPKKKARYVATPANVKFSPKQVLQKRVERRFYVMNETLQVTEDRNYEFKAGGLMLKDANLRNYVQKYGIAFLNSEGGILLGGVRDDGRVIGVFCNSSLISRMQYAIDDEFARFRPQVKTDKYRIKFMPVHDYRGRPIDRCFVVELHIYKGDSEFLYESSNHQVFIRRDGGVQGPLRPLAIKGVLEQNYQKVLAQRRLTKVKKSHIENQTENQTENRKESRTKNQNEIAAENQTSNQTENQTESRTEGRANDKKEVQAENQTRNQTEIQTENRTEGRANDKKEVQAENQTRNQTEIQTENRNESLWKNQNENQTDNQSTNQAKKSIDKSESSTSNVTEPEQSRKRKVQFIDLTNDTDEFEEARRPVKINRTFKRFFDDVRTKFRI